MKHFAEVCGQGEKTAIFLPGTGWAGNFGMPIAELLVDEYMIHMLDLPGIGRSDGLDGIVKMNDAANWLNEYLEEKKIDKVTIIGHSLGGGIGMSFAYYYPEKVVKMILLDIGFARIERFPVDMFGSVGYFLPMISMLHRIFGQRFLGEEKNNSTNTEQISQEEIKEKIKSFGFEDNEFIRNAMKNQQEASSKGLSLLLALYRWNLPKTLNRIKTPCLVLYGNRKDKPIKFQKKLHRQVNRIKNPNIIFKNLNGGHYAHVNDNRALSIINSYLQ
ncbi:alpha/beta fold hydrolase [Rossellomorea sp. LjRoot5]|uniref:alpha/beta fold hydrolase n=1 Tax=Rossellomorea sp. LjRoot5 TaxID=3342331 RepID=UPI003ECE0F89